MAREFSSHRLMTFAAICLHFTFNFCWVIKVIDVLIPPLHPDEWSQHHMQISWQNTFCSIAAHQMHLIIWALEGVAGWDPFVSRPVRNSGSAFETRLGCKEKSDFQCDHCDAVLKTRNGLNIHFYKITQWYSQVRKCIRDDFRLHWEPAQYFHSWKI